jgi:hypothetical protein
VQQPHIVGYVETSLLSFPSCKIVRLAKGVTPLRRQVFSFLPFILCTIVAGFGKVCNGYYGGFKVLLLGLFGAQVYNVVHVSAMFRASKIHVFSSFTFDSYFL